MFWRVVEVYSVIFWTVYLCSRESYSSAFSVEPSSAFFEALK